MPPERVHVLTPPSGDAPPAELWRRFCGVLGIDPGVADSAAGFGNTSLGVVEAETLRRVNERLVGFDRAFDRGVWIRSFLADERLVPRGGDRFWPDSDQQEDCRRRGEAAVALVRERGYAVVGALDALLVPDRLPERRHPSSVTESEVASVAVDLVAHLLGDLKEASDEAARREAAGGSRLRTAGRTAARLVARGAALARRSGRS